MNEKKIILLLGFLLSCIAIDAQWTQVGNDIDGVANANQFGWKVSLSDDGLTMAASAPYNNDGATNAGHVRIFQNTGGNWTQVGQSITSTTQGDGLGRGLSLNADGTIVAVGAPFYDNLSGYAQVYQNISGVWTQIGQDIEAENNGDFLGSSMSLNADGTVLAVGALYHYGVGFNSGLVRIFKNINGDWTQVGNSLGGDIAEDFFGYAVSLNTDGSIIAISAPINNGNGSTNIAYTRVFQNVAGDWVQLGADIVSDSVGDQMGTAISISADGTILALGGTGADGGNGDHSGAVRIYEYNGGDWTQIGQDIPGETAWDFFGESVSLNTDGTIVAAGASASDDNGIESGHVRVFRNDNGAWVQIGHDIVGEAAGDRFGSTIDLNADGAVLAAGATANSGNGSWSGHVRVFHGIISGVEDYLDGHSVVSVFPNPTTGVVQITSNTGHLGQLTVLDVTGRLFYSLPNDEHKTELAIDFSAFANGVYFIRIVEGNSFRMVKVVKQ